MRPLALDLCCGAGGASMGLFLAGFDVIGIDIRPQPRYPFTFVQADALQPPFDLSWFDFIWASPPCQAHSVATPARARERHANLIPAVRALLHGRLHVMENVEGAPLRPDLVLDGSQFGLPIIRRRVFEVAGFRVPFLLSPGPVGSVRNGDLACVAGHGAASWNRIQYGKRRPLPEHIRQRLSRRNSADGWREAMGIDWMVRDELSQAIPPAYAAFIGRAVLAHLGSVAA